MSIQIKNQYVYYGEKSYVTITNLKNVYIEPGNNTYKIDKSSYIINNYKYEIVITPNKSTFYTIFGFNQKNEKQSFNFIIYVNIRLNIENAVINKNELLNLYAYGSINYTWTPSTYIVKNNNNQIIVKPLTNIKYNVSSTDEFNYTSNISVTIQVLDNLIFTPSKPVIYEGDLVEINVKQTDTNYNDISYTWRSTKSFELPLQYANITYGNLLSIHPFFSVSYLIEGKQNNILLLRGSIFINVLPKPSKLLDKEIIPIVFYQEVISRNIKDLQIKIKQYPKIALQVISFYKNILLYAYKQEFTNRIGANLRVPWKAYYNKINKTNNFIITFTQQWKLYKYINLNQRIQTTTNSNYAFLLNSINQIIIK